MAESSKEETRKTKDVNDFALVLIIVKIQSTEGVADSLLKQLKSSHERWTFAIDFTHRCPPEVIHCALYLTQSCLRVHLSIFIFLSQLLCYFSFLLSLSSACASSLPPSLLSFLPFTVSFLSPKCKPLYI